MAKLSVYNIEGNQVGEIELNDAVFGVEVNENKIITLKTILRYWVDIDSDESRRCTQCV